jgi:hypothetical protein
LAVDAGVRAKLDRIMASGYFTAQLEMRTPLDLAAAVASFGAGGVQVQESMVVSPQAPEAVEESQAVEGHKVKSYFYFAFVNVWLAFVVFGFRLSKHHMNILSQFQIIRPFTFSCYIAFTMHLHIQYV